MKPVATKYYKISVTMKTGFKYSVFCASRQLEGMKNSSDGYWTEKIEVTETTEDEYRKWWWGEDEKNEKPVVTTRKKIPKVKELEEKKPKGRKKSKPEVSGLEEFFVGTEAKKGKKK